jgi:uncharacterized protein (TIGR02453 family)
MKKGTLTQETLNFFKTIEENNNKPWFESNRTLYEAAKANYLKFMEDLLPKIRNIDQIVEKDLKKYPSRIHRDIRFSKDKSPYKNNISSLIERELDYKKCPFYIQIQPNGSFIGGGVYQPEPPLLKRVRQEIDYNSSELHKIIGKPSFKDMFGKITGDTLIRPPKGYDEDNPNIELLKLKNYIVHKNFTDEEVMSTKFTDRLAETYREALPFFKFLDNAIVGE